MGVPIEFKTREELLKNPVTKMTEYGTHNQPAGTWSDDTSMMIATIDSINAKNAIDIQDIALKFVAFKNHASYTATNEVFDIGNTCSLAISKFEENHDDPTLCGINDINANGNGSLMRILPIAYYAIEKKLKEYEILELVRQISSITHAHEISIMGCYFYVRYVIFLLNGKDKYAAYSMARSVDYAMFKPETQEAYNRLIKEDISKYKLNDIKSTGYVVDSLEAAIWVTLKSENYKEAVIGAINLGGDTDTIGAITGALAGIIYGYDFIPEEWKDALAKKEYLMDIFEEFSENIYE
jgi:ADP-ribosylglycohydrolase